MGNAENECLVRAIRLETLAELLVVVLVDYSLLDPDLLGFIVELVDMLFT